MARVYLFRQPGVLLRQFYTVERAVGKGSPNQRDDVLLVQFFIRRILEGFNVTIPGERPLAIDGQCGRQTQRYIQFFQKDLNTSYGKHIVEDGVVSPMANRAGLVGKSDKIIYTMVALNTNYSDRYGKEWHSNLAIDPLCPAGALTSIFWQ